MNLRQNVTMVHTITTYEMILTSLVIPQEKCTNLFYKTLEALRSL